MNLPVIARIQVEAFSGDAIATTCDCLVIALSDSRELSPAAARIDSSTSGWVTKAIDSGAIKTGFGELTLMPFLPGVAATEDRPQLILWAGVGDLEKFNRGKAFDWGALVTRRICDVTRERIVISLEAVPEDHRHDAIVAGAISGGDGQSIYMTEPKINAPKRIDFAGVAGDAIVQGRIIGDSINVVRRLVNEPPNRMYPESFTDAAMAIANDVGLTAEVWDENRLTAEGCRAMLAVGEASARPPRLLILHHRGGKPSQAPLAIVGKGVTFDSGGLSIKPSDGMVDMKCDMAGAATVVGVMRAIAMLDLPVNVIGLCGLVENMIAGNALKLGDVIETRQGTMIEILNTDAEGRVVLADVLDVAVQFRPSAIVDLATLTGACMVALGRDVAGLMANNESLCNEIQTSASEQGEFVWPLPMFDFYGEHIKSKVADIKNVGDARWGGAITAAKFLEKFVDDIPWVHVDIAGPAFAESPKPHRDAGATGVMLRTLVGWLNSRAAR
ncbi:MAG: leucyl aminopeptidase family protein [Planctomycetaceae bacterium]